MPLIPNLLERWALRHNRAPGVMLDLIGATAFHSVGLAIDLAIFDYLADEPKRVADIAGMAGCDQDGISRLLDYLAATAYLKKRGDSYSNTPMAARWLVRSRAGNVADFMLMWRSLLAETWPENLEFAVKNGSIKIHLHEWMSLKPGRWTVFNRSMAVMAQGPATEIAERVDLPVGARRFLDIGGNHGQYSAAFCRRNPSLMATIFDVPEALDYAIATNNPQFDLRHGDIRTDDPGSGYDAALISNLIHYFGPDDCRKIIKRTAETLAPGGLLIVSDQVNSGNNSPLVTAFLQMMSLHYFAMTSSDAYPPNAISSWMEEAGCRPIRDVKLKSAAGQMLIIAEKIA